MTQKQWLRLKEDTRMTKLQIESLCERDIEELWSIFDDHEKYICLLNYSLSELFAKKHWCEFTNKMKSVNLLISKHSVNFLLLILNEENEQVREQIKRKLKILNQIKGKQA